MLLCVPRKKTTACHGYNLTHLYLSDVRELSQRWVGCHELRQQRKAVQSLSETTNVSLKKNVYDNYTQFIETAKEITHLESEMYQLSHLLSEQKALLDAIYNSNIHADVDATVFPDKTSDVSTYSVMIHNLKFHFNLLRLYQNHSTRNFCCSRIL